MAEDQTSELVEIGVLTDPQTLGIGLRLEIRPQQTVQVTLTPQQVCDLVAKLFDAGGKQQELLLDKAEAMLPDELSATKIRRIEAKVDPAKSGEILLRLSVGYVGVVLSVSRGSLENLSNWLTELAASPKATQH